MTSGIKYQKSSFWWILMFNGVKNTLQKNLGNVYLLDSRFSVIRMTSWMIVMKECVPLTMLVMEKGKRHFLNYHSNVCWEEKCFINSMDLVNTYIIERLCWLDKRSSRKSGTTSKVKKQNSFTFHHNDPQCCSWNRNQTC